MYDGSAGDGSGYHRSPRTDDVSGQKDLNQVNVIYDGATLTNVDWNWDDTAWSGQNTGDACALFDANNNGFADSALCQTVGGTPAGELDTRLYSCGDARADRCSQPTTEKYRTEVFSMYIRTLIYWVSSISNYISSHVSGNTCKDTTGCYTDDTTTSCTILGSEQTTTLLAVCSYPSEEPNSDPSDCIVVDLCAGVVCDDGLFCNGVEECNPETGECTNPVRCSLR